MSTDGNKMLREPKRKARAAVGINAAPDVDASTPDVADPWSQRGIYIRLSKQRKAALLRVAASSGHSENPHQALSACIDSAARALDIEELRGEMDEQRSLTDFSEDADALASRLDDMNASLARIEIAVDSRLDALEAALSPLVNLDGLAGAREMARGRPSARAMESWLNSVRVADGGSRDSMALVEAHWAGTRPDPCGGSVAILFDVHLMNAADADSAIMAEVEIPDIDPAEAMAHHIALAPFRPFIFACQKSRSDDTWIATLFPKGENGQLGESIGSRQLGFSAADGR